MFDHYRTLLTDAIREPTVRSSLPCRLIFTWFYYQATWNSSLEQLKTDPRFNHSVLPLPARQDLFSKHVAALRKKHLEALHSLFEAHAPGLHAEFSELPISSIQASLPTQKLRLDKNSEALESEYRQWRQERVARAEREFREMLNENSFVEFWGRVRKMREETNGTIKVEIGAEDLPGEDDASGRVDLKTLAKSVDVQEIERVLKVCTRVVYLPI